MPNSEGGPQPIRGLQLRRASGVASHQHQHFQSRPSKLSRWIVGRCQRHSEGNAEIIGHQTGQVTGEPASMTLDLEKGGSTAARHAKVRLS